MRKKRKLGGFDTHKALKVRGTEGNKEEPTKQACKKTSISEGELSRVMSKHTPKRQYP